MVKLINWKQCISLPQGTVLRMVTGALFQTAQSKTSFLGSPTEELIKRKKSVQINE